MATNQEKWDNLSATHVANRAAASRKRRRHNVNWHRQSTDLARGLEGRIDKFATEFGLQGVDATLLLYVPVTWLCPCMLMLLSSGRYACIQLNAPVDMTHFRSCAAWISTFVRLAS